MLYTKFYKLKEYFEHCDKNEVTLTFKEVEQIIGFQLTPCYYNHAANWSNTYTLKLPPAWLDAGYRSHNVDMEGQICHFTRVNPTIENNDISYKKGKNEERLHPATNYVPQTRNTRASLRKDAPTPSIEQVEFYLSEWEKLEDYSAQERAIDLAFNEYKNNNSIENILIKCSILNDFYSTNIFKIYPVAKHILSLNIDERLKAGDPTLVNDIASVELKDKEKRFYSFATKYCSHHDQLNYPIYDYYVGKVLTYFKRTDRFFQFTEADLRSYPKFKNILIEFRKYYKLESYNLKELDKFLWQFGKKYFPKKQKTKKEK